MQSKEPTASLVHTLGDEVCGEYLTEVRATILKRVVNLRIRHSTRIKPYIDKVALALHRLALRRCKHDRIDIGTVQVDILNRVVLLRHIADLEVLVGILGHIACRDTLLNLRHKLLNRTYALKLRAVLGSPNRQRRTPETRTREVPVVQILQPLTKAACTRRFGLPKDGVVKLHHALLQCCCADKPRIKRIVKHRLVCSPAVGVVVDMLLNLEGLVDSLQREADIYVERLGSCCRSLVVTTIYGELRVVSVLHPAAFVLSVSGSNALLDKLLVQLLGKVELTLQINHRTSLTALVNHEE